MDINMQLIQLVFQQMENIFVLEEVIQQWCFGKWI